MLNATPKSLAISRRITTTNLILNYSDFAAGGAGAGVGAAAGTDAVELLAESVL